MFDPLSLSLIAVTWNAKNNPRMGLGGLVGCGSLPGNLRRSFDDMQSKQE
jgi:hypothetical protein